MRSLHVPIAPATHPDMDLRLLLEDELSLRSNSYIKIKTPLCIPIKLLQRLGDGPRRLMPESYRELQARIDFSGCFSVPVGFLVPIPVGTVPQASRFETTSSARPNRVSAQPLPARASSKPHFATPPQTVGRVAGSNLQMRNEYPFQGNTFGNPGPRRTGVLPNERASLLPIAYRRNENVIHRTVNPWDPISRTAGRDSLFLLVAAVLFGLALAGYGLLKLAQLIASAPA